MSSDSNPDAVSISETRLKLYAESKRSYSASWEEVDTLCAIVRGLEAALRKANEIIEKAAFENGKLKLQLAQVTQERDALRSGAKVVEQEKAQYIKLLDQSNTEVERLARRLESPHDMCICGKARKNHHAGNFCYAAGGDSNKFRLKGQ